MEKNMAIDPVCGMEVDKKTEFRSVHLGETYYFCSREDKEEFLKHPDKYMKKHAEAAGSGNPTKW